jgi:hypothetical protein
MKYLKTLTENGVETTNKIRKGVSTIPELKLNHNIKNYKKSLSTYRQKPSHQEQKSTRTGNRVHKELQKETFDG